MAHDNIKALPFETDHLRRELAKFLKKDFQGKPVGGYKYGVYAFYDYDNEPIYVGQTNEKLSTRIRRHLTNHRTDAVAMSVLDPLEVFEIRVWPLPEFQGITKKTDKRTKAAAVAALNQLEYLVHQQAIKRSKFKAILNEKDPPRCSPMKLPAPLCGRVVSDEVFKIRSHPDTRIARRALIISKLAQVINERKVSKGLRRTLLVQAKRLEWLAARRHKSTSPRQA